jgi:uncharacterized protein YciI
VKHFWVTARDARDEAAPARRAAARDEHVAGVEALVEAGSFLFGGALLDEHEEIIGSVLVMRFDDREAFDGWLQNDAYTTTGVWESVDVRACRPAAIANPPWERAAAS